LKMIRIMFVCHGNICRSPSAEFIMKHIVKKTGVSEKFYIASSATSTEEIICGVGNPIYPPARRELEKNGIVYEERCAVQLKSSDYDKYDYFIGMDSANIRNMHRIFSSDPKGKISKLLSFTGVDRDVSDPWYSGCFDEAFSDIYKGCEALLHNLINNKE